jgi:tetratricopeptide (TPR) repeat protein
MLRLLISRHTWSVAGLVALALTVAAPVSAQTGIIKGKVVDTANKPVEGAKVTIEFKGGTSRRFEVKTNRNGEFIQIGLQSGAYAVTAEKEKVGTQTMQATVRLSAPADVNFVLGAPSAGGAGPSKEEIAKTMALRKLFDEGVAASKAGQHDDAIGKFTEAAASVPNCFDCYYNIGFAHSQKKEYDKAEAAFKKALELKADYAEAYNGLATIYNAQRKFDEAAAASQKATELSGGAAGAAGGAGNVDALYNQGVILWNSGKIPEAKKLFEDAIKANPNHPESHYQLGMALVNEGKLPEAATEFEAYLKLAPDGQYAAQAKAIVGQLKK